MDIRKTKRGFARGEFDDLYGNKCSIQESSLADEDAIWLGVDDANPKILASTLSPELTGWVKCPMPEGVSFNTRMHLTREQVSELLPLLQRFVETGEL